MANAAAFLKKLYADPKLRTNCSGLFKAAAWRLAGKQLLPDLPADKLIEQITTNGDNWIFVGTGVADGQRAADLAAEGYLVAALLKAADHYPFKYNKKTQKYDIRHPYSHGHMAIVLPGETRDGYPFAISGSIVSDGQSDGSRAVKGIWREVDAKNVQYYRTAQKYPLLLQLQAS